MKLTSTLALTLALVACDPPEASDATDSSPVDPSGKADGLGLTRVVLGQDTVLKSQPVQSSSLSPGSEACPVRADVAVEASAAVHPGSNHLVIDYRGDLPGCRIPAGPAFLYAPHVSHAVQSKERGSSGLFTTQDGLKIHYEQRGQSGPWVVLLHGLYADATLAWDDTDVMDVLAQDFRVVAIDSRGHGGSDKPHDPARYGASMARDVLDVMDHLDIDQAHFHGYSMGGTILIRLIPALRGRILSVAFGGSGLHEDTAARREAAARLDVAGQDPDEPAALRAIGDRVDNDPAAIEALQKNAPWQTALPALGLAGWDFPVIALFGQYDNPRANTARFARVLPRFRGVVVFRGKSHVTTSVPGFMPPSYPDILHSFFDDPSAELPAGQYDLF